MSKLRNDDKRFWMKQKKIAMTSRNRSKKERTMMRDLDAKGRHE